MVLRGSIASFLRPVRYRAESIAELLVSPFRLRRVAIEKCLLGGEHIFEADKYARLINDPLRPSTPISRSPHVKLLQQYQEIGDRVFEEQVFRETAYYRNVLQCIRLMGNYFEATRKEDIVNLARKFVNRFKGEQQPELAGKQGHSSANSFVSLRPIRYSDCFQVIDGHHRLAIDYVRGEKYVWAKQRFRAVLTPLQSMLLDVLWEEGRHELYQPIDAPELKHKWRLVRRCTDRFTKMENFLRAQGLLPPNLRSYIDIGSNYGWFVSQMGQLGFESFGLERDPIAASVGFAVYGVRPEQIFVSDCVQFLRETDSVFDVTSCLSVLHHFVRRRAGVCAEEFIHLIDRITGRILFLDMGQSHEQWFQKTLPEWDADFIEDWLKKHTSFRQIYRLGIDEDSVPPFEGNYSRMLFACVK